VYSQHLGDRFGRMAAQAPFGRDPKARDVAQGGLHAPPRPVDAILEVNDAEVQLGISRQLALVGG
jgi:hypothetical protein